MIKKTIKKAFGIILNIIFPLSDIQKKIESLDASEILEKCERAEIIEDKKTFSIFSYEDPLIKEMVHLMKYKGNKKVAWLFAEILYAEILENLSEMKLFENFINPILIPIPLSQKRLKERGFNQVELILKELRKIDKQNIFEINNTSLIKIKNVLSQTAVKNRRRRMQNIRGCFGVKNSEKIRGRNIILIDDVLTTGATMREAKNVLLKSGARKIICITIAH